MAPCGTPQLSFPNLEYSSHFQYLPEMFYFSNTTYSRVAESYTFVKLYIIYVRPNNVLKDVWI